MSLIFCMDLQHTLLYGTIHNYNILFCSICEHINCLAYLSGINAR